jgi:hypothetical protein
MKNRPKAVNFHSKLNDKSMEHNLQYHQMK